MTLDDDLTCVWLREPVREPLLEPLRELNLLDVRLPTDGMEAELGSGRREGGAGSAGVLPVGRGQDGDDGSGGGVGSAAEGGPEPSASATATYRGGRPARACRQ